MTPLGWSQSKYSSPASRRPESTPSTRNPPFCRLLTSTTALPAETAAHTVTILCVNTAPLPIHRFGAPVAYDVDGRTPLYLGTAHAAFGGLHPCRVQPGVLWPAAYVAHAGLEHGHGGRVDVLVIDTHAMEWVPARDGEVPRGWRPIVGGCEADGRVLFYAIAPIEKVRLPGKTGRHLVRVEHLVGLAQDVLIGMWSRSYSPGHVSHRLRI
ncbi:hypothetical protein BC628DRAFT_1400873 [Trametes gibbosa]|nr:hypothetical protein BC628DRAFT_1400873 [Trametes gibbosa]